MGRLEIIRSVVFTENTKLFFLSLFAIVAGVVLFHLAKNNILPKIFGITLIIVGIALHNLWWDRGA